MDDSGGVNTPGPTEPGTTLDKQCTEARAFYEYTAFQIHREDGLINHRLTWALQLNGFLFAALALIGDASKAEAIRDFLTQVLPLAGIATNVAGIFGIVAANLAINDLKKAWIKRKDRQYPRPFGGPTAFWLGIAPSILLPAVLMVVWLFALCRL